MRAASNAAVVPIQTAQDSAPLYESVLAFVARNQAPFYCPGHKGGRSLPEAFRSRLAEFDLNNLPDTDTLHCPEGPILRAEQLLADAYGVDYSFILVGGSTLGNTAAVMSAVAPGEKVLVQRNAHKSTVAGIIQADAEPVWLCPQWDREFGIHHGLSVQQVAQAFDQHPDARALVVLNPTYFGTTADIRALAELCSQRAKLLLVDEAHGPHFRFHPDLPVAAEDAGADLVVQSTHKILSGLSQAAVLHLRRARVDEARVRKVLQLLQTTSPNFAIMASIDLARRQMAIEGRALLDRALALSRRARAEIEALPGLRVLGPEDRRGTGSGFFDLDLTKLVLDVSGLRLSGAEVQRWLNQVHGIQPELAGATHVLFVLTLASTDQDVDRLVAALSQLVAQPQALPAEAAPAPAALMSAIFQRTPELVVRPRAAFFAPAVAVPFAEAPGRVCAEVVTPYPPGIPLLMPGERITGDLLEYLSLCRRLRCPISATDSSLSTLRVLP